MSRDALKKAMQHLRQIEKKKIKILPLFEKPDSILYATYCRRFTKRPKRIVVPKPWPANASAKCNRLYKTFETERNIFRS
jgi:hypothetical protein